MIVDRYWTLSQMHRDPDLTARLTACAALEQIPSPQWWVTERLWALIARTDMIDAYAFAVLSGALSPGKDATVITEQMILGAVQSQGPG